LREAGLASAPTVTRIDGNASLHAGWPPSGVALSSIAPQDNLFPLDSQLLRSGATHGLAVWSIGAGSGKRRWLVQRFGLEGAVDPAWPADGLEVVAADTIVACRAIEDGSGGAYIVRQSHGRPVATHVSSSGTFIGSPDTDLLDAGAQYVPTLYHLGLGLADGPHDLIADATADGGLLIGWSDTRLSPAVSFRLRWLTPALAPAPDKPAEPVVFFPGSPAPFAGCMLALKADGTHGAFVAWSDRRVQQPYPTDGVDLWMAYVALPVAVGVQAPSPAFSVSSPRPNPAIGSVVLDLVLPDDSPARIELLDIAGRVIRSQLVEGAGPHAITFNATGSLAPGLYFAHVTSRNHSTAVRVVVSR
jgi:hypothetical protein